MRGGAFFNGKEGRDDFRNLLLILSETDIIYLIIWAIGYMKRMMISSHWICMQSHFDNHVM